jgi:acetyl-CoA acyltransferase
MQKAVIAGYLRTPFHFARKGGLINTRPDDLSAQLLRGLVAKYPINPADIEDVLWGCSYPEAEQGNNMARIVSLLAGLPISVSGMTVNRFCGSSMSAIHIAAGQIAAGAGDLFICGGVESMSRVPQGGFNFSPNQRFKSADKPDAEFSIDANISMGETAENVADRFSVARSDQDRLAWQSQQKAHAAQQAGRLCDEIMPVTTPDGIVAADGCLRPQTTLEGLAGLKPVFRTEGTVTAGTASPLTDGAAATLVCSEEYARANGLPILARIRSFATTGCEPEVMGMGPVGATRKALARAGLTIEDIGIVEMNEAFASQAIACIRELGIGEDKLNLDGGGIAIGHPLGATGARITGKAAQLMQREGKKFGLSTQCIGGGQGVATILEAV